MNVSVDALTVPCLLLFSKTMIFALAGILTRTGCPLSRPCELKLQSLCRLLDSYTLRWGSVWGPGWRECQGQRNIISTRRLKRGPVARELDFEVKCLNGSSGIWQGRNFSSELRKGRRWEQRELQLRMRTMACQGCQHEALQAEPRLHWPYVSLSTMCIYYVGLLWGNKVARF